MDRLHQKEKKNFDFREGEEDDPYGVGMDSKGANDLES